MENENTVYTLVSTLKRLGRLYIENARLGTAEKLTLLLSAMAWLFIRIIFIVVVLVFMGIVLMDLLDGVMSRGMAALIALGFYFAVLALVYALRKKIIVDPIARYVSKQLVSPPESKESNEQD